MKSIIVILAICISGLSYSQNNTQLLKNEIQKIIRFDTDISIAETKGFIIGIVDHDSTYIIPFQSQDPDLNFLRSSSVFEIGGLTKVFTAHLLCILDYNGLIDLKNPINEYIPKLFENRKLDISISDLLSHTAGMPKLPQSLGLTQSHPQNPHAGFDTNDALTFYAKVIPESENSDFEYSHFNYALIQAVVETHFGQPIQYLFDEWIFRNLSLNHISFDAKQGIEPGFSSSNMKSLPWTYQAYAASLGLNGTLGDLINYLKFHLKLDQFQPELSKALHHKNFKTKKARNLFIGNGWYIFDSKKTFPIYTHAGHTGGHKSFMGFVKETQTGVVVLARSKFELEDLGLLILRLINDNWKRKNHE